MQQQKSEDYSGPTRTEGQFPLVDLQLSVTCVTNRVRQIINHSRILVHRYQSRTIHLARLLDICPQCNKQVLS